MTRGGWRFTIAMLLLAILSSPFTGVQAAPAPTTPASACSLAGDLALLTPLTEPGSLALDSNGDLYIADRKDGKVWRLTPEGLLLAVAGGGAPDWESYEADADGTPATSLRLYEPAGLALDQEGNVYISEGGRVRRMDREGRLYTVIGGRYSRSTEEAYPYSPGSLAADKHGNLFVADPDQGLVFKVAPDGAISIVAGGGEPTGESADGGRATAARLYDPRALALDDRGNLYIAAHSSVHMVTPKGIITTLSRATRSEYSWQEPVPLSDPISLAIDRTGNLLVGDAATNRVFRISRGGTVTPVVGGETALYLGDGGPAAAARLSRPAGLAMGQDGTLYIADTEHFRVRLVDRAGTIRTVAGSGVQPVDPDSFDSRVIRPELLAVGPAGDLYFRDSNRDLQIEHLLPDGTHRTIGREGPAGQENLTLNRISRLAADAQGNLYVGDEGRVIRIAPDGNRKTIAGTGKPGFNLESGPARSVLLTTISGMVLDAKGNLYLSDMENNRVRKVTPDGRISTVAGNGRSGSQGDGGPAAKAAVGQPRDLALDPAGNLYILQENRVRMVDRNGQITTVSEKLQVPGADPSYTSTDRIQHIAVNALGELFVAAGGIYRVVPGGLLHPVVAGNVDALAADPYGNLFAATESGHRIDRIGPEGLVTTVAGPTIDPLQPYMPGPELERPWFVVADDHGSLYLGDAWTGQVLQINAQGRARLLMTVEDQLRGSHPLRQSLTRIQGLGLDGQGNLYVAGSLKVYRIAPGGQPTVVAGNGNYRFQGDGGPAVEAGMAPGALAVARNGTLYIADLSSSRVRRVTPDGTISTYAGSEAPRTGFSGEGGPATKARLKPLQLVLDREERLLIGGPDGILRVNKDGTIHTLMGPDQLSKGAVDLLTFVDFPPGIYGMAAGPDGQIYFTEGHHNRIRVLSPDGAVTGLNSGERGDNGDGPIQSRLLEIPAGLFAKPDGTIYFTELNRPRVRRMEPSGRVTTIDLAEPAPVHAAATGRAEATAAAERAVNELLATDLRGADPDALASALLETTRAACPGASDEDLAALLTATLREQAVLHTPAMNRLLEVLLIRQGNLKDLLTIRRQELSRTPYRRDAYEAVLELEEKLGLATPATVFVNGIRVEQVLTRANVTGIPIRVAESLGAVVAWDWQTDTYTVTRGSNTVQFTNRLGSITLNGAPVPLPAWPAYGTKDLMMPAEFLAEALGWHVTTLPDSLTVIITDRPLQ